MFTGVQNILYVRVKILFSFPTFQITRHNIQGNWPKQFVPIDCIIEAYIKG
jgi:hypothetical protein